MQTDFKFFNHFFMDLVGLIFFIFLVSRLKFLQNTELIKKTPNHYFVEFYEWNLLRWSSVREINSF